ncbi:hypothetical protein [Flavobacterium sp.]|uniref:hypothetical protein n=1 Tax=Flavobacterium sp. TaxID=239 RepID=UPI00374FFD36
MTKKTIPILICLLLALISNAQITKGNWMVGGSGYFNNSNAKNSNGDEIQSSTGFAVQPNLGYFFYNRFAGGLMASYSYGKTKGGNSNSGLGVGPFIRYYILKPEKIINFLLEANYYYGKDFNKSDYVTNYGFKAGPVIYFNSSVGLELLAKYQHVFYSSDSFTSNSFQIGLGFQIHLEK